ncbi:interactor of constitutive active ROPs 2, chloroplastic isoform X2 [Canna indica]|uniref:Interactor of constitutive active ROPs 2, chloroplastic isoform X2 n=1 Tax=Canna indica TaxID=4628 RepID=A0AAQ3JRK3_9LILI|nr:interactor of constitutive active ROPs 2, chloroplastic isoform X2 [Canna indica]
MAMTTIQSLSSKESFSSDASESKQPSAKINPWERLTENLKENDLEKEVCCGELSKVEQLRSALEALEIKYQAGTLKSEREKREHESCKGYKAIVAAGVIDEGGVAGEGEGGH